MPKRSVRSWRLPPSNIELRRVPLAARSSDMVRRGARGARGLSRQGCCLLLCYLRGPWGRRAGREPVACGRRFF